MCLILFSLNDHPVYKLIVAANRDEFFARRTAPVDYWSDHPEILGGRDLEAHGTWMAMTKSGKIAMVTNYRDPSNIRADAPSRGKLVSDYLLSDEGPVEYLHSLEPIARSYNGFNLLLGSPDELYYFSNYADGVHQVPQGLHGLSNHLLETPWPKVVLGKEKLRDMSDRNDIITPEKLFTLLYDDRVGKDELLPNTGVGKDRERMLSSMFIKTNNYGTRCSTVVLVTKKNEVIYAERIYDLKDYSFKTKSFQFNL